MGSPTITIVGLGPGDERFVTRQTLDEIAAHRHRYLRTAVHPAARLVEGAHSFDHVYESAPTFDAVYATIVDSLIEAAHDHGDVLYAVPGSPLVLERTVRSLRAAAAAAGGFTVRTLPAMSFLDLAYDRLGLDPVESGLRLIDGHDFAVAAAGHQGPMLIAHTHANWVLSDVKLAAEQATGDEPVVILQGLGTDDERIVRTTWSELDRAVDADHLTSVYVEHLGAAPGTELMRFHRLARTLREQCPWDREQTHASLVRYLIEETYEVVDALGALDPDDPSTDDALVEELGDLLYQIEFHATIAEQQGRFTMADIAQGVHDKLVRRHPHVFGQVTAGDAATVESNWDAIKRAEKQRTSVFDGVAMSQPALSLADTVQRKAAKAGFDWPDVTGALAKIQEEAGEVVAAAAKRDVDRDTGAAPSTAPDTGIDIDSDTALEVGDLLFAVVNVARHLGVEPESALRAATVKFRTRFTEVERLAAERGVAMGADADLATLDALWDEVKRTERRR